MRRFTLQTLRDFGVGKTSIEEKIFDEIDAASDVFHKTEGKPIDVRMLTSMIISNVIYGIVFSRRYILIAPDKMGYPKSIFLISL